MNKIFEGGKRGSQLGSLLTHTLEPKPTTPHWARENTSHARVGEVHNFDLVRVTKSRTDGEGEIVEVCGVEANCGVATPVLPDW